ncbi:MAG: T9SS type A sorting domain-containing protein [Flavisolibacter sp.]
MKPKIYLTLSLALALILAVLFLKKQGSHSLSLREKEENEIQDRLPASYVGAREKYEFDMLKDPATGKLPDNIFEKERRFAMQMPLRGAGNSRETLLNTYLPAGPNNMGGRTRAVAYDLRYNGSTNKVIIAGCVSGGIMRSIDGGNTWNLVTPQNDIHSFTTVTQDPRAGSQDTWYAAGGEPFGNSAGDNVGAPYMGYGIWKSTNDGATWTKLPFAFTDITGTTSSANTLEGFDHPFDFVHRLSVNPVNGDLYVACHRRLIRSTDGGASFQTVFGSTVPGTAENGQTEVCVTNTGKILLGVNGGNPDQSLRGVWVSTTGAQNSFSRIAGGQTLGVDSVPNWRGNDTGQVSKRIVMTLAPSNNNIAYVFYENGLSSDAPDLKPEADLFRLDISGNSYTWTNLSANMPDFPGGNASGSDPLTVQGGYDMVVAVKPDNPNMVFVAGSNLYRSTDGFTTTANTSWIAGYQTNFTYSFISNSHPDIHNLVFNPSSPNEAICANDGGIQRTPDITAAGLQWDVLPNYQTLQYYYVAMDPDADRNNFAGGAQDNGANFRDKLGIVPPTNGLPTHTPADSNNHYHLVGGDGCAVGISKIDLASQAQYLYGGSQYGNIQRVKLTPSVVATGIRPNGLTLAFDGATNEYGEFVTNFRVDQDNTEDLYYVNFNRLFRTTAASSVTAGGWVELTGVSSALDPNNARILGIRALAFTRGPYHSGHSLFLGTTNGKIYRLDDPRNAAASKAPVNITPASLQGNVQEIAVNPNNDNEIMAVVSNYGVVGIWWTGNAKSTTPTWKNAEGSLTLPSMRCAAIVVKKDASNNSVTEYYVGTSVGLYSVANLGTTLQASGSPNWQREGLSVLNLAVVESMTYRPVDNVLLIGTHGNGMYYSYLGTPDFVPTTSTGITPVTNDRNFIRTVYPTIGGKGLLHYETGNMIGIKKITVQLLDLSGRMMYQEARAYQNGTVSLDPFASGSYILSITSEDSKYRHIQKIIKQ